MLPARQNQLSRAQEADKAEDQLLSELNQTKENQALPTPEATPEPGQSEQSSGGDQD